MLFAPVGCRAFADKVLQDKLVEHEQLCNLIMRLETPQIAVVAFVC